MAWKVCKFGVFLVHIYPHLDQKNSKYGHFLRCADFAIIMPNSKLGLSSLYFLINSLHIWKCNAGLLLRRKLDLSKQFWLILSSVGGESIISICGAKVMKHALIFFPLYINVIPHSSFQIMLFSMTWKHIFIVLLLKIKRTENQG